MLKDNGNSKPKKKMLKCDKCKEKFNVEDVEVFKIENLKFCECPYCGQQQILNK